MRKIIFKLVTIIALSTIVQAGGQVVVNVGSGVKTLSKEDIKSIFNLQKLKWSNGTKISVYLLPSGHEVEGEFCQKILDSSSDTVMEKWMAYVLNGGANKPPKTMKAKRILKKLKKQKGAIGILPLGVKLPDNTISVFKL